MTGFYLLVFFPPFVGLTFALWEPLRGRLRQRGWRLDARSEWLYLALLMVPLSAAVYEIAASGAGAGAGIRVPALAGVHPAVAVVSTIAVAMLVGAILYCGELLATIALYSTVGTQASQSKVLEGASQAIYGGGAPRLAPYIIVSVLIVAAEEFLWRGFLGYILADRFGMAPLPALLVSSILFGINHAYFGMRNVALKAFDGFIWGTLMLATSSLLAPILSHLTFQFFVWRRMRRREPRAAFAV